jgi:exosome complex component RRP42
MAPLATSQVLLSPAELSYLHASLSLSPPLRPDLRGPFQFRPLTAETDVLAGTNGSARICYADGTEAIVGIKAEVEKSLGRETALRRNWIEVSTEIPGLRDNDSMPVYLSEMIHESLISELLTIRLSINIRFHWKLYIDVRLLPYIRPV